jgi:hypothetical protein
MVVRIDQSREQEVSREVDCVTVNAARTNVKPPMLNSNGADTARG